MATYLITWTTYGTWLHGDDRGSVSSEHDVLDTPRIEPNRAFVAYKRSLMREAEFVLSASERRIVDQTIRAHCEHRGWRLHAVNLRTNHVHVVCAAPVPPERVLSEFKAWSTRRIREAGEQRERLWTRHGSTRWIDSEPSLRRAIEYVQNEQE